MALGFFMRGTEVFFLFNRKQISIPAATDRHADGDGRLTGGFHGSSCSFFSGVCQLGLIEDQMGNFI